MKPDDFASLARLLRRRSGLLLTEDKRALTIRRLEPVMRRFGFRSIEALIAELQAGREALAEAVTEAMTVNETSFFRDSHQFARLRDQALPQLLAARAHTMHLRVWSAAAAAGQEIYSLAMMLDGLVSQGWTIDLIATDLSGAAIARAQAGHYHQFELQRGLSYEDIARHFQAQESGFRISERLRRMVTFRRFNLLDSYGWLGDLDLVLCRNVLIYFDGDTKTSVLDRIADALVPDGMLMLGEAEAPEHFTAAYGEMPGGPGLYRKAVAARLSIAV